MATMFTQPTVVLLFGLGTTSQSAVAFDVDGELLETVAFDENGVPQWNDEYVAVCDHRGAGGEGGYVELLNAMNQAEANAKRCGGGEVSRVDPAQWGREV